MRSSSGGVRQISHRSERPAPRSEMFELSFSAECARSISPSSAKKKHLRWRRRAQAKIKLTQKTRFSDVAVSMYLKSGLVLGEVSVFEWILWRFAASALISQSTFQRCVSLSLLLPHSWTGGDAAGFFDNVGADVDLIVSHSDTW